MNIKKIIAELLICFLIVSYVIFPATHLKFYQLIGVWSPNDGSLPKGLVLIYSPLDFLYDHIPLYQQWFDMQTNLLGLNALLQ